MEQQFLCDAGSNRRLHSLAFTLVEMLVTITILAILSALTAMAWNKVRTQANCSQSASNLRQIGIALSLAAQDQNGTLPSISRNQGVTGSMGIWNRCDSFTNYMPPRILGSRVYPNEIFVSPGHDYGYSNDAISTTYGAGSAMMGFRTDTDEPTLTNHQARRFMQIHEPSTAVLVVETRQQPGRAYGYNDVNLTRFKNDMAKSSSEETTYIDFRYRGLSNVLFADGHVESFTFEGMRQSITPENYAGTMDEPKSPN